MRNKLILLGIVLSIIVLVLTQLYNNGAEHVDVVDAAITLEKVNTKLVKEKEVLEYSVNILQTKTETSVSPNIIIEEKIKKVKVLIHDTVVIYDTVFIKEQKNFWGKTKRDTLE